MFLGRASRLLLLVLAVAATGTGALLLAWPWLPDPSGGPAVPGFAGLVTSGCAVALLSCWAWLALGALVVAAETVLAPTRQPGRGPVWVPRVLRILVPALLGAAVGVAPAHASSESRPALDGTGATVSTGTVLTGLPLPDRALSPRPDRTNGQPVPCTVRVRPGDTLWAITSRLLPPGSAPSVVDRGWRRVARANADRVPDPDLIHPGARLRIPPLPDHPREEAR